MKLRTAFKLFAFLSCISAVAYAVGLVLITGRRSDLWTLAMVLLAVAILCGCALILTARQRRRRAAGRVLDQLEQCVLLNLPLPRAMAALTEDDTDRASGHLSKIAFELADGKPISLVLQRHTVLPQATIRAVAMAEQSGQLDRVIPALAVQRRRAAARRLRSGEFYRLYPLLLAVVLLGIVEMLRVFVGPRYAQIFRDFHQPMPWIARVTMLSGGDTGDTIILILFMLSLVVWLARSLRASQLSELRPSWLTRTVRRLPVVGQSSRDEAWSEAFTFIADSMLDQRDFLNAVRTASLLSRNSIVRSTLDTWASHVQHGQAIDEAAREAPLPSLLMGLLSTKSHSADVADVLRFCSDHYLNRSKQRDAWMNLAFAPVVALSMGFLVAWVALSVFVPMTRLIYLTGTRALVIR